MYINRESHGCAVVNFPSIGDGIMVSGGKSGDAYRSTEFFSFSSKEWRILADMNDNRYGHGLAQINGRCAWS